ncbi:MAG: rhomboid family intramembrane serine protease [Lachnospiraceae bacterium]|nr:rhomboid family intramembrane serine protease [Lachnospiraceae bacterium]
MYQTNLSVWKEKITTIGLVVLNIFLFIISVFSGDLLYNEGAFSLQYVLYGKEWWRTITSMFLHADADHLVGNMLMLYFAGEIVEKYLGKRQYVILYFFSGITGSLFYAAYEFYTGSYMASIGASGAVFGLIGALLVIVVRHKGKYGDITLKRMGFMIVYMIYMGLRTSNVNNAAHIGGLICGILLTCLYMLMQNRESERS